MSRKLTPLFGLLLLLGAAVSSRTDAAALPVPTPLVPKAPTLYYPTTVGAKWLYQEGDTDEPLAITAVETKNGVRVVTVSLVGEGGKSVPWGKVAVSEKGLEGMGDMQGDYDRPFCLLKLPSKPGDGWIINAEAVPGFHVKGWAVVHEAEQVEVPAGRFTAVRVVMTYWTDVNSAMRTTCWYAAGVGLVKMSYHEWGEPAVADKVKVLKSFTLGKG